MSELFLALKGFHWWWRSVGAHGDGATGSWSIDVEMDPSDDYVLAFTALSELQFTAADYGDVFAGIGSYQKRDPSTGSDSTIDFSSKPQGIVPVFSDTNVSKVTFLFGVTSGGDWSNIFGWLSFQLFWIGF